MKPATSRSALRVQELLGSDYEVLEFEDSTRTAADAAAAIGCDVAQIAKSLLFRAMDSDRPVLVIASGPVRVNERRVSELLGETLGRADAGFVRDNSGFAIGGVPPLGHRVAPVTFIDETLFDYESIWAAAGTPKAVFRLTAEQLAALTGGTVTKVS